MEKLKDRGIDVFPHQAEQTHSVFEVVRDFFHLSREELEEKQYQVKVPGRIIAIRKMAGQLSFTCLTTAIGCRYIYGKT